jgi:hypothetical protein
MALPDETTGLLAKSDQRDGVYEGSLEETNITFSSREVLGLAAAFLGM